MINFQNIDLAHNSIIVPLVSGVISLIAGYFLGVWRERTNIKWNEKISYNILNNYPDDIVQKF